MSMATKADRLRPVYSFGDETLAYTADDDSGGGERKPVLSRLATDSQTLQRRRRVFMKTGRPSTPRQLQAVGRELEHAAKETYLITRLTFTLLRYLGYSASLFFFIFIFFSYFANFPSGRCLIAEKN